MELLFYLRLLLFLKLVLSFESSKKPVTDIALELKRFVNISASSTCGEIRPEKFCIVSTTGRHQGHHCSYCDSRNASLSHPITNAIDGTKGWWQSANDPKTVAIFINLRRPFFVTSIYLKMGPSYKPAVWSIEKSVDYGQTYQPWLRMTTSSYACQKFFGMKANDPIKFENDVQCRVLPIGKIENEEIMIDLIKERPGSSNFMRNEKLQNWIKATNVKLVFHKMQTLLGEMMMDDSSIRQTHFYTIRDIIIGGRCICQGQDSECKYNSITERMECKCLSNTCDQYCGLINGRCNCIEAVSQLQCNNCTYINNSIMTSKGGLSCC